MSILLATLCLNEMEWLPKLYEQHYNWPGLVTWVFVEAADQVYADANPGMVNDQGLSVDGTSQFLKDLSVRDFRVVYIPHGFTSHPEPDQGKCAARQRYADYAGVVGADYIFVIDADEFYTFPDQEWISSIMTRDVGSTSFCFQHIHPWRPPAIVNLPLFKYQITGGLWDIGFVRGWRYSPGVAYRSNHNHLSTADGVNMTEHMNDYRKNLESPKCVHMGFTSSLARRQAKHRYYVRRGEGKGDGRGFYVKCRRLFETWKLGDQLPEGVSIDDYAGPIPECFQQ
jgi:hypothetical protein